MKTISTPGSFWKVTKILKQEAKNSPQLESTLVNNDKNVRAVHYELPISRMDVILPADFDNGVVLENEEEGLAENTLFLLHLGRNSNDASLDCHDNLAPSAFQAKGKSICLETTIPPLTTRTAEEVPKQHMALCANRVAKGGANSSVTSYLGSRDSFSKLKTTISNPDAYGIYWYPNKKSKRSLKKPTMGIVWDAEVISCKCPS